MASSPTKQLARSPRQTLRKLLFHMLCLNSTCTYIIANKILWKHTFGYLPVTCIQCTTNKYIIIALLQHVP
jgi:hypothetical protein